MTGMVIRESILEIRVMDAPTEVSCPYAAGMIMVFKPRGMASVHMASGIADVPRPVALNRSRKITGIITRRIPDTKYIFGLLISEVS